jgi:hypothetical protein
LRINITAILLLALVTGGCIKEQRQVSFRNNVQPILVANCIECHIPPAGEGYKITGLSMATYADLMQGTIYGPVIVPGDSQRSILNKLVEGRVDSSMRMPHGRNSLGSEDVEILRLWVEYGALPN